MENDLIKGLDSLEEKVDVLVAAGERLKMTSGVSASYAAKQDSDLMMIRINAACDRLEAPTYSMVCQVGGNSYDLAVRLLPYCWG